MEKLIFQPAEDEAPVEFTVIAQLEQNGHPYLLVSPPDDGDAEDSEAYILRDDSAPEDEEALYTMVEDETELATLWELFRALLDDEEDITLEDADL